MPLTVKFTGSASSDEDPGDSIRFEWDFGDGSPISTEANPTHIYTKAGRYTAVLSVYRLLRAEDLDEHGHHGGQHQPDRGSTAPLDGGMFSFGDKIQYKVTVTDPEDPSINCNDVQVTFVLGHDTHGHAEEQHRLHRLPADRSPRTSRTAATCSASSARATPTRAARAAAAPPLTDDQPDPDPPEASGGRVRRQPVRHEHGDQHRRRGARRAPRQPRGGRLAPAERSVQPVPDRHGHVPRGRRGRGPHGGLAAGGDRGPSGLDHRPDRRPRRTWSRRAAPRVWSTPDVPDRRLPGKHELFFVFRAVTGGPTAATCST